MEALPTRQLLFQKCYSIAGIPRKKEIIRCVNPAKEGGKAFVGVVSSFFKINRFRVWTGFL